MSAGSQKAGTGLTSPSFEESFLFLLGVDGPAMVRLCGVDLLESLAVASVTTRALQTGPLTQPRSRGRFGRTTHLAAFHDSMISSSATIGRICPSFALFLQTGHSCFEVMEFLMHCTFSVVKRFGTLSDNPNPPASRNNVHTTGKWAPYRTLCISCRSTKSRGAPAPSVESLRGPQYLNPVNFAGNSS